MNRKFFLSLAEVTIVVYGTTFFGLVAASGFDVMSIGSWKAAAVSAFPAAAAVVYGGFARLVGNYDSALAVDTRPKGR